MKLARIAAFLLLISTLVLAACSGGGDGLPAAPGRYKLKEKSISFDGDKYSFFWADAAGNLKRVQTDDVKLRLGDENLLEITDKKEAILHVKQDEPVTVEGRDEGGDFGSFWYPFLIGSMLMPRGGPVVINQPAPPEYRDPVYRYPPTDSFGRGDTIAGNAASSSKGLPDYSRLAPVGGAVSGQSSGAGGGNAATNRASTAPSAGGQSGGTGAGSAALSKSGSFKAGSQGFDAKVSSGRITSPTGNAPKISTGGSRAPSIGGSRPSTGANLPRISTGRRR